MFFKRTKLRSFLIFASLLLALSLAACIGPDNPLILDVDSDPEADVEAEAAPVVEPIVGVPDVDVSDVEVSEVAPVSEAGENAVPAKTINFDQALMQATFLLNRDIKNLAGAEIGDVEDVVIDMQTGQILYVILDRDAFLGLNADDFPLPLSAFGWNSDLDMILTMDETLLDSIPGVEDDWPVDATEGWDADVAGFWNEQALLPARDPAAVPGRLQSLIGIHAGGLGADLGIVEDFLINLGEEQVAYLAIFTADGFYAPDRVLLVPFTTAELAIEAIDGGFIYGITLLEVDEAVLNSAPFLDRSIFLTVDLMDQAFAEELNTYWSEQAGAVN